MLKLTSSSNSIVIEYRVSLTSSTIKTKFNQILYKNTFMNSVKESVARNIIKETKNICCKYNNDYEVTKKSLHWKLFFKTSKQISWEINWYIEFAWCYS